EVPTISEGAAEFSVRGLVNGIPTGALEDAELFVMYDGSVSPDPETNYFGFRNNRFKFLVRKRDTNAVKIVLDNNGWVVEDNSAPLSWDPGTTYRFRVEWGRGSARVFRDGTLLKTISPGGMYAPRTHRMRQRTGGA